MKLGTENRTKVIAAVALGVVAVAVIAGQFSGWFGGNASNAAAPSVSSADDPVSAARPARPGARKGPELTADPSLRLDVLQSSESTSYEGTGRNIFKVFVEIPKPIVPPVKSPAPAPAPAVNVPPPPPPIPLTFYGFATPSGGAKRIFLAQGEDVFIAKEGDIVDRRYKVVRIAPNAVEILDVLSNNRQSIPLTQG